MRISPEGLTGLVVRAESLVDRELELLTPVWPELARRSTRVLTTTSGLARLSPDRHFPSSLFTTAAEAGIFRRIAVGQDVRLFRAPWSEALLWHLNRLLADDGEIILPFTPDDRADRDGKMSRADIERLFGHAGEAVTPRTVLLQRSSALEPARSILPWFVDDAAGLVHQQALVRNDASALRASLIESLAEEFVVKGLERHAIRHPEPGAVTEGWYAGEGPFPGRQVMLSAELSRLLKSHVYLLTGVSRKLAAVRTAVARYGITTPGALVDIGGAMGFVAAEALLDPDLNITKARVIEYDQGYAAGAARMYRALRADLRGRFEFAVTPAQDDDYDLPIKVATLFSSLLYIPRDGRRRVLDGLWDALEPGGVLVVYEVLKTDPPSRDHAIQYTAAEIDATLGRYGEIHRIGATAMRDMTADQAGEATVFRVVTKR